MKNPEHALGPTEAVVPRVDGEAYRVLESRPGVENNTEC